MKNKRNRRVFRLLLGTAVAALVAGCAVGPDFKKPAPPDAMSYSPEAMPDQTVSADIHGGETQKFVAGFDIPGQWWTLYHSAALNELIEQALKKILTCNRQPRLYAQPRKAFMPRKAITTPHYRRISRRAVITMRFNLRQR